MPIIDDISIGYHSKAAPTKKLIAEVILDRSGSMGDIATATVDAYNEYVNGLAHADGLEARVSLTIFDSESIDLIRDKVPASDPKSRLSREEYIPRAGTPLNDAIGKTVARILGEKPTDPVAFVILTDGMENASTEYTTDAIKALLERAQKQNNWLVLFLAANIDSFAEGVGKRGTQSGHTMGFSPKNMRATFASAARASGSYGLTGNLGAADFTEEERKKSGA